MNLQYRIDLLLRLGEYILSDDEEWRLAKEKAGQENGWFIPEFVDQASINIARAFLQKEVLGKWSTKYQLSSLNKTPKNIGVVMAGNIPLVGFHDWLCIFISGHKANVKPSIRDQVLIEHLAGKLENWEPLAKIHTQFSAMLKGCDAYIATGSNNSSRYFEYYFGKYPHIIRRNRTSVAVLTGEETNDELEKLADDVYLYFGLGCRNVTKIYTPAHYDFVPLLSAFKKYNWLADHHKYKNNYDYNLALHLLNKKYYMTNGSILLVEEPSVFSPISQLNYEYYDNKQELVLSLRSREDLQSIIGMNLVPFGQGQSPAIDEYADGVDTLAFVASL